MNYILDNKIKYCIIDVGFDSLTDELVLSLKDGDLYMMFGKVKWFDTKKGFGFIEAEDGSGDVFVHYTDLSGSGYRTLEEGERVKFEVVNTPKGRKAEKVERVTE